MCHLKIWIFFFCCCRKVNHNGVSISDLIIFLLFGLFWYFLALWLHMLLGSFIFSQWQMNNDCFTLSKASTILICRMRILYDPSRYKLINVIAGSCWFSWFLLSLQCFSHRETRVKCPCSPKFLMNCDLVLYFRLNRLVLDLLYSYIPSISCIVDAGNRI